MRSPFRMGKPEVPTKVSSFAIHPSLVPPADQLPCLIQHELHHSQPFTRFGYSSTMLSPFQTVYYSVQNSGTYVQNDALPQTKDALNHSTPVPPSAIHDSLNFIKSRSESFQIKINSITDHSLERHMDKYDALSMTPKLVDIPSPNSTKNNFETTYYNVKACLQKSHYCNNESFIPSQNMQQSPPNKSEVMIVAERETWSGHSCQPPITVEPSQHVHSFSMSSIISENSISKLKDFDYILADKVAECSRTLGFSGRKTRGKWDYIKESGYGLSGQDINDYFTPLAVTTGESSVEEISPGIDSQGFIYTDSQTCSKDCSESMSPLIDKSNLACNNDANITKSNKKTEYIKPSLPNVVLQQQTHCPAGGNTSNNKIPVGIAVARKRSADSIPKQDIKHSRMCTTVIKEKVHASTLTSDISNVCQFTSVPTHFTVLPNVAPLQQATLWVGQTPANIPVPVQLNSSNAVAIPAIGYQIAREPIAGHLYLLPSSHVGTVSSNIICNPVQPFPISSNVQFMMQSYPQNISVNDQSCATEALTPEIASSVVTKHNEAHSYFEDKEVWEKADKSTEMPQTCVSSNLLKSNLLSNCPRQLDYLSSQDVQTFDLPEESKSGIAPDSLMLSYEQHSTDDVTSNVQDNLSNVPDLSHDLSGLELLSRSIEHVEKVPENTTALGLLCALAVEQLKKEKSESPPLSYKELQKIVAADTDRNSHISEYEQINNEKKLNLIDSMQDSISVEVDSGGSNTMLKLSEVRLQYKKKQQQFFKLNGNTARRMTIQNRKAERKFMKKRCESSNGAKKASVGHPKHDYLLASSSKKFRVQNCQSASTNKLKMETCRNRRENARSLPGLETNKRHDHASFLLLKSKDEDVQIDSKPRMKPKLRAEVKLKSADSPDEEDIDLMDGPYLLPCNKLSKESSPTEQPEQPSPIRDSDYENGFSPSKIIPTEPTPETDPCYLTESDLQNGQRVLTLIEGLFYAGCIYPIQAPDVYGINIDGERHNRPHIYSREEVLKEAFREIKPFDTKACDIGRRVCAYWSRRYRMLYPGRIVSPALITLLPDYVAVEFDDGDIGNIPVDQIRYLPNDYPHVFYDPNPLFSLVRKRRRSSGATDSELEHKTLQIDTEIEIEPKMQPEDSLCETENQALQVESHDSAEQIISQNKSSSVLTNEKSHKKKRRSKQCKRTKETKISNKLKKISKILPRKISPKRTSNKDGESNPTLAEDVQINKEKVEVDKKERKTSDGKMNKNHCTPRSKLWEWCGKGYRRKSRKEFYKAIQRGTEIIQVGDCAVFLSAERADRPYIGEILLMWESSSAHMTVKVKWFYHPGETKIGKNSLNVLPKGALFASQHMDENDVQTIARKCTVLSYTEYCSLQWNRGMRRHRSAEHSDLYFLAGSYDPITNKVTMESDLSNMK